jgi:5-methylcytosine-specific restriction endonuclease McrA
LQEALKKASRPSQHPTNKRLKTEYKCASCENWFARKDVEIDHKIPCGQLSEYEHIADFIKKLATENVQDYQILCKPCHLSKSLSERKSKKEE